MAILPWTLLSRRTAFHAELQATPAEIVMGDNPKVPADLTPDLPADHSLGELLKRVKSNAQRPPQPTRMPKQQVYWPSSAAEATHVYTKRAKTTPLGPAADGPYPIEERLGKSSLKIKTGTFVSGKPRTEVVHWRNCIPHTLAPDASPAERPKLGRPKKQ